MVGVGFYLSPQDNLAVSDAIVVVSGGETNQRVAEGVKLYKADWAKVLIMSGAARDAKDSNAAAMKRMAINSGIPANKIITEEESMNTFENAAYVRGIVESRKLNRLILVTSPYHQRRAALVFAKALAGLPVKIINHSSLDSAWRKNGWWLDDWARKLTWSEVKKVAYTLVVPFPYQK
ncbi:hypothetical protein A2810_01180 [candidate division Kazan bacterium RIFCSPHIGHO2_01_FULL_49_10]|uniref:DUF218 domain-containing protein n=1 Tax=candidate division Kazan bacterium RIFCSPLOWO2_01_FULL_48_13 TaxID=1798539 RepID=A0A1F4PPF4_UNCK3|nr:MAG: hypothetical protein A2810_01180 [candidate division Kazan bacterium RIFCSPHIGHO2_01_FULL_49_10]OGB85743.1 MAG: hypothetical protein A2994_02790 [candidate division Kazan bacterium RIFCSPLOWO2_01_FULL_48_13]